MSVDTHSCWCGNTDLTPYGPSYVHCARCETLVARNMAGPEISDVKNDETDLYGRDYWFGHQAGDLGLPTIVTRSRTDLPERCLYWLRALLKFKKPPARVLELASAHGGFVALLQQAGFEAAGLELSPWVVDYARKTFGVTMLLGAIEVQDIPAGSLDAIAMMDVLEHLPDPVGTLRSCLSLLKPDGVLLLQTPSYRESKSYEKMVDENDYFLNHMRGKAEKEHLFLYSPMSVSTLLKKVGFEHVQFEPAIFAIYDMFLVASRSKIETLSSSEVDAALLASPTSRLALALIDLDTKVQREYGLLLNERNALREEAGRVASLMDVQRSEIEQLKKSMSIAQTAAQTIFQSRAFKRLRALGRWAPIEKLLRDAFPGMEDKQ
jgi:2-polyprenyl-3-methyl-5-hydroxy-6-metoxy-1,4-benzoquinol methylase